MREKLQTLDSNYMPHPKSTKRKETNKKKKKEGSQLNRKEDRANKDPFGSKRQKKREAKLQEIKWMELNGENDQQTLNRRVQKPRKRNRKQSKQEGSISEGGRVSEGSSVRRSLRGEALGEIRDKPIKRSMKKRSVTGGEY